jgi:Bacterial extracellular solute-binding protein, family 7
MAARRARAETIKTAAEPRDFRAVDTQSNDHPTARALVHMSELVSDRTQGRHRIIVYSGGVLGEQKTNFEQTRAGVIDINRTNMAPLVSFVGKANILGLPFLFRSADHLHRILNGPIGEDRRASNPHGFVGLAFFESGARSVYSARRPVQTIDDIKGLRIRLQESDLMVEMFATLGAEPVILPYTLTKTALTTGLIDAAENNWALLRNFRPLLRCSLLYAYRAHHDAGRPDRVDEDLEKPGSRGSEYLPTCGARLEYIFARPMEKSGGEFPQASTGLRRDCHRNRPEAATSRIDGPLYESSDGFALKTSCRVHPKRLIKFSPLVHSVGSFLGCWISPGRPRCSPSPTRSSNDGLLVAVHESGSGMRGNSCF